MDSCIVNVQIIHKKNKNLVDSLIFYSLEFYGNIFLDSTDKRSDITGVNRNMGVNNLDNNAFGSIVVADFNFDSKEDVAIVNACYNSGNHYNFYVQNKLGKFQLDSYLTDSMKYFPMYINKNSKTLETNINCGTCGVYKSLYQYKNSTKGWVKIEEKLIDVCE